MQQIAVVGPAFALSAFAFSHAALAQQVSEDEYLNVEVSCPTDANPVFQLYAQNRLGDRDRVTLTFANGEVAHVSLAAGAIGYAYEEVFGGTLKDLDARGLRNADRIVKKVAPSLAACRKAGDTLRRFRRQLMRNKSLLRIQ